MHYFIVTLLSRLTASRAVSFLENPSAMEKYKTHLLTAFGLTESDQATSLPGQPWRCKTLQTDEPYGHHGGTNQACFIFRKLFLQHMPDHVYAALANTQIKDFREVPDFLQLHIIKTL